MMNINVIQIIIIIFFLAEYPEKQKAHHELPYYKLEGKVNILDTFS